MASIQFPPNKDEELLWWNKEEDLRLRLGKIIEVGSDTHAFKVQFRDGSLRFPTSKEMESRCTSHNKFTACEVAKVQLNIQEAMKEIYEPSVLVLATLSTIHSPVDALGYKTGDNATANEQQALKDTIERPVGETLLKKPDEHPATYAYQDSTTFPFGYPDISPPNVKGDQSVKYSPEVTRLLSLPLLHEKPSPEEKRARNIMKKRMSARLHNLFCISTTYH